MSLHTKQPHYSQIYIHIPIQPATMPLTNKPIAVSIFFKYFHKKILIRPLMTDANNTKDAHTYPHACALTLTYTHTHTHILIHSYHV